MLDKELTPLQEHELELLENELDGVDVEGIANGEVVMDVDTHERFRISGLETLGWAFKKLAALTAKQQQLEAYCKAEVERVQEFYAKELKGIQANSGFFQFLIEEYVRNAQTLDPKYKGEKTPYGAVALKKQQPEWKYTDEDATVAWLEANELGALVKTETLKKIENKTDFKKVLDVKANVFVKDGVVVDAVTGEAPEGFIAAGARYAYRERQIDAVSYIQEIVDKETGEVDETVKLYEAVAVERMTEKVVPGVSVAFRPDAVTIKAEV